MTSQNLNTLAKKLSSLKNFWFFLILIIIVIVFILNRQIGIWIALIISIIFVVYYIPSLSFKNRLLRAMSKYPTIEDKTIAKELNRSLEDISKKMQKLYKKQKRAEHLIISLNKRYIFYNKHIKQSSHSYR
jgi:Ca2+/Na+ antiporter